MKSTDLDYQNKYKRKDYDKNDNIRLLQSFRILNNCK